LQSSLDRITQRSSGADLLVYEGEVVLDQQEAQTSPEVTKVHTNALGGSAFKGYRSVVQAFMDVKHVDINEVDSQV
jgi:hypothetical protein